MLTILILILLGLLSGCSCAILAILTSSLSAALTALSADLCHMFTIPAYSLSSFASNCPLLLRIH
jgi:hypothetical protein